MNKGFCFLLFMLLASCEIVVSSTPSPTEPPISWNTNAGVSISQSTVTFSHWNYTENTDHSIQAYSEARSIVSEIFNVYVIENGLVRIKVLPEYGGRILSIIYKPTGHEQLYQNPVGSPYGRGEGNFYYNWLMVYGGIFPTFPEPEHGKTWLLPWAFRVLTNNSDQVTVEMSITDNTQYSAAPGQFDNGITGLICKSRISVYRGRSVVEMAMTLTNPAASSKIFEYWTCTTLTPGSVPGNTVSPGNSKMVVPITQIKLKSDWWSWMDSAETKISGYIYEYKNLALFENWDDMGIGYAQNLTNRWWGVINGNNNEGIFRIADNQTVTPGLKFWTWGYPQSLNFDATATSSATNGARPYIELWAGMGTEFLQDQTMGARASKVWTETYIPTVGLTNAVAASEYGSMDISPTVSGGMLTVNAQVFSTRPGETVSYLIRLEGASSLTIGSGTFTASSESADSFSTNKDTSGLAAGNYKAFVILSNSSGKEILRGYQAFSL